jgi:hypothetical protein
MVESSETIRIGMTSYPETSTWSLNGPFGEGDEVAIAFAWSVRSRQEVLEGVS